MSAAKFNRNYRNKSSKKRGETIQQKGVPSLTASLARHHSSCYNKGLYRPKESTQYMDDLLRSVNNKNFLLLNPAYEKAYPLDQSVRVGKSVYTSNNVKSLFTKFNLKEVPKREIDLNTARSFSSDEPEEDFVDRTKEYKKVKQDYYVKKMTEDLDETENNETMYQQDLSEMNTKINSIPLAPR